MIDVAIRHPTANGVLRAVTANLKNLLFAGFLIVIVIYQYGLIGFFLFSGDFAGDEGLACSNILVCALSVANYGLRLSGGIGDLLVRPNIDVNLKFWILRLFYDLSFYIVVLVVLLNVVFGIILDSFAQIRDRQAKIQSDIASHCYICSLPADAFNWKGLGFDEHIKRDHNMYIYVYLFAHLQHKDPDDFTATEQYIFEKYQKKETDFFPLHKALVLDGKDY